MTGDTPLDAAFRAAEADPDPALRLRFHERILDAELAVPLAGEAGAAMNPRVFDLEDGRFVLAFDRDERLAEFFGTPADFAALSGRRLAALLAGRGIGLALNLGAPSATLLPPAAVDWLAAMVRPAPVARDTRLAGLGAPEVPPAIRSALAIKLAAMADTFDAAHLISASASGERGERAILVLTGVPPEARPAVAAAIAEAVRFTPEAPEIDVAFLEAEAPDAAAVARVGHRLDLPRRHPRSVRSAPGTDPARPPKLR